MAMWIYDGISTDRRIPVIADRIGQSVGDVFGVWFLMMRRASEGLEDGYVTGFDPEVFAAFLRIPVEAVEAIAAAMSTPEPDGSPGMIHEGRITGWRDGDITTRLAGS